jgi:hypothetical protein
MEGGVFVRVAPSPAAKQRCAPVGEAPPGSADLAPPPQLPACLHAFPSPSPHLHAPTSLRCSPDAAARSPSPFPPPGATAARLADSGWYRWSRTSTPWGRSGAAARASTTRSSAASPCRQVKRGGGCVAVPVQPPGGRAAVAGHPPPSCSAVPCLGVAAGPRRLLACTRFAAS